MQAIAERYEEAHLVVAGLRASLAIAEERGEYRARILARELRDAEAMLARLPAPAPVVEPEPAPVEPDPVVERLSDLRITLGLLQARYALAVEKGQWRAVRLQEQIAEAEARIAALEELERNPPVKPDPEPWIPPPVAPPPVVYRPSSLPRYQYDVQAGKQVRGPWGGKRWTQKHMGGNR